MMSAKHRPDKESCMRDVMRSLLPEGPRAPRSPDQAGMLLIEHHSNAPAAGFGAIGLDAVASGDHSAALKHLYLREAGSTLFRSKLAIHNVLAKIGSVGKEPWITSMDISETLRNRTDFRLVSSILRSNVNVVAERFVVGGVERTSYIARTITHHEMLHIAQFLRKPNITTRAPVGLIHEILPSLIGTPEIYIPLITGLGALFCHLATL